MANKKIRDTNGYRNLKHHIRRSAVNKEQENVFTALLQYIDYLDNRILELEKKVNEAHRISDGLVEGFGTGDKSASSDDGLREGIQTNIIHDMGDEGAVQTD